MANHMMQTKNQLMSGVFRVMYEGRVGEATGGVPRIPGEVGVEIGELRTMSREKVA